MEKPDDEINLNNKKSSVLCLTIDTDPIYIDLSLDNIWYEVPKLSTEIETPIMVGEFYGFDIWINGIQVSPNSVINIRFMELKKTSGVAIKIVDKETGIEKQYVIKSLPQDTPDFVTLGKSNNEGFYYFACNNYILKMNILGEIVFYKQVNQGTDFKMTEINGEIFYSYLTANPSIENPQLKGSYSPQMKAVVMDSNYHVIDEILYLSSESEDVPEMYPLESHEFKILDKGHYILSGYVGKRVNNIPDDIEHSVFGARVVACIIQEIKDGELIFEWDSTDWPELYGISTESYDYFNEVFEWSDYAHLNSIDIDPNDNNFVCSFRNLDTILKISRNNGEIIWNLGGKNDDFGLISTQKTSKQHFARFTEKGTLTVFDNGNVLPETGYPQNTTLEVGNKMPKTRVVEYKLDEKSMKLIEFKEYYLERSFSPIMGSALRLDNNDDLFLIGWGGRKSGNALFSEINFSTNKVEFEVMHPWNSYSDDSYRVYKFKY